MASIDKNRKVLSDKGLRPVCIRIQAGIFPNTDGDTTISMFKAPQQSIIESASFVSSTAITSSLESYTMVLTNTTAGKTIGWATVNGAGYITANAHKALTIGTSNVVSANDVLNMIVTKAGGTNTLLVAGEVTFQANHRPV